MIAPTNAVKVEACVLCSFVRVLSPQQPPPHRGPQLPREVVRFVRQCARRLAESLPSSRSTSCALRLLLLPLLLSPRPQALFEVQKLRRCPLNFDALQFVVLFVP